MEQQRIIGVDFSGAKAPADKIWVTLCHYDGRELEIMESFSMKAYGSTGMSRETAYAALVGFLAEQHDARIGMDFPFSIPLQAGQHFSWRRWIQEFPGLYPTAEAFRYYLLQQFGYREVKRTPEKDAKVPFAVNNLRLYKQSYFGIKNVLRPLLDMGDFSVFPFWQSPNSTNKLYEACPSCTLKHRLNNVSAGKYKGPKSHQETYREGILQQLYQLIPFHDVYRVQDKLVKAKGGDALDSLITVYSVLLGLADFSGTTDLPYDMQREGYIMF